MARLVVVQDAGATLSTVTLTVSGFSNRTVVDGVDRHGEVFDPAGTVMVVPVTGS